MDKLEAVREVVDGILRNQPDDKLSRNGFVHLYGVAVNASLLAAKRGLDPLLSTTAGMLHDISTYKTGDSTDHARLGSIEAKRILTELGSFTQEAISTICTAILHHRNKGEIDGAYDELLKDADVLQHYFYNTSFELIEKEKVRLASLLEEFGVVRQL